MTREYTTPTVNDLGTLHDLTLGLPIKAVGTPKDASYPKGFPSFTTVGFT